jgi:hypothetical protein
VSTRPTSITVVAWILIVLGAISLITTLMLNNPQVAEVMSKSPIPISAQYAMTYASLLVMLISGIAMLRQQNWGRWLYVIGTALGFLAGVLTSPMKEAMIPGLVVFAVVTFFLFRPKANAYFSGTEPARDAQTV